MSSLIKAYKQYLLEHNFNADSSQETLIMHLQKLLDQTNKHSNSSRKNLLHFWRKKSNNIPSVQGIYVWGNVGGGKTFLLDLFFQNLLIKDKKHLHFHEFMREIHHRLSAMTDTRNPLEKIAHRFAQNIRFLYLDEFHIIDIGDAMILGDLLKHLLNQGVKLALTSNFSPPELYKNGLQRQRFLPAIALIENYLEVFELKSYCDYRLKFFKKNTLYNTPVNKESERIMANRFKQLITDIAKEDVQLNINDYSIQSKRIAGGVVWFDFDTICGGPRSVADYLEIAKCYQTILISGIPLFKDQDDLARRFINMIDIFYDHRVRFIASAEDMPKRLYLQGRLKEEFRRTASRLIEMQSPNYITQSHK